MRPGNRDPAPVSHQYREQLRAMGRTVLWEGAKDIVFEAAE